jgi:hypothetical protein
VATPLESLIVSGTKLWLDSIDPDLVQSNRELGATGATSNPVIVADLLRTGRFDDGIRVLMSSGHDDSSVAWQMTDRSWALRNVRCFHGVFGLELGGLAVRCSGWGVGIM